jgi:hypothetical protein
MNPRILGLAAIASVALLAASVGQASATTACTSSNGTTTLPTGSDFTVGSAGCEIGSFNATEGQNSGPLVVNSTNNPDIYSFTWGGGVLKIQEEIGNNGSDFNINVELGLLSGNSLQTGGNLASELASTDTPYQSGPSAPVVVYDANLAGGTYVLDTYLGSCGIEDNGSNCGGNAGDSTDPDGQVLFTPVSATPLPGAMPLFATGMGLVGMFGWRRKRKNSAAIAAA